MYGAIIGDVVGSPYEFSRNKRKDFSPLFHPKVGITDDTIMTVAVADSLLCVMKTLVPLVSTFKRSPVWPATGMK